MHGHADSLALIGDGPGDGLPDPPDSVGREAVTAPVVELGRRANEADIALLYQIEQGESLVAVALGHADNQAEIGLHHDAQGLIVAAGNALTEVQFLLGSQSGSAADFA